MSKLTETYEQGQVHRDIQVPEMELLRDYAVRGHKLEGMALFDFILTTHEGPRWRQDGLVFVPYLADSYKRDKGRLIRVSREEVVPEVFGGWPPALQNIVSD
ncbi:hypothetical protein PILCRDRAFT_2241 [Piloderma croceum F 1598]|uniref:Uncharacterized protein n=1 Tax=Piloderma croceum (strain F 1598) TaxID=765440 RepID=A0A0C3G164_PILCF|nr:hypothetical protein PILCRDRAFT_2241 [Piloderma croceum F 1598]